MRRACTAVLHAAAVLLLLAFTLQAQVSVTSLADDGWYSDDTRADGAGTQVAGTNLKSMVLTDAPENASGLVAHEADIFSQISFVTAPGTVPSGTWPAALHLKIGASASGKSQISHRKDTLTGHGPGSSFGAGFTAKFSWMANGTISVTPSLKFGIKTAEFGSTGISTKTGENAWDKVLIYEPGNLNGGTADGLWHTETINFTTGKWWFFDRKAGAGTIGTPVTLSAMVGNAMVFSGAKTIGDVYALITAPGAVITSVQFGIGSGNAGGSVYVNQFQSSAYLSNAVVTFGTPVTGWDQNVTSNAIYGSGNANGSFTTVRVNGLELGMRGKLRYPAANVFNSNGDGTYTFNTGSGTGLYPNSEWSFEFSVNTDYDNSTGLKVGSHTYKIGMDNDPGPGANYLVFDPISAGSVIPYSTPVTVPFWDHSMGDNSTAGGAGVEAGDAVTYATNLATYNLAQNSWRPTFYQNAAPYLWNPNVPGRYEYYLAAYDGATELARTHITIIVNTATTYDQNVTSNAIYGGGNANGSFTVARAGGVELGMRGKLREPSSNIFNSNGDGTYTFNTGSGTGSFPNSEWNFDFSVNTNYDGSSGLNVGARTYRIGMDNDPGPGTNYLIFDPISIGTIIPYTVPVGPVPYWDHSMGTNATLTGAGVEAGDGPTYAGYLTTYNLAQNSWRPTFYQNMAPYAWNPNVPGHYEYFLAAYDGTTEVARTAITLVATNGTSLLLEADACQSDQDCNLPGVQVKVRLYARNLASAATGYQAFLSYNSSLLSYVGASSSYSASPFSSHLQPIATADVVPGQLRLDGSSFSGSTIADSLLATLVFTVANECTPFDLDFDLTQAFDSELSYVGVPLVTSLMNSGSLVADATPPVLGPSANINVAADASLAGGCSGRVVTFATPVATDNCSIPTVACYPPSGSTFPVGTTVVSCVATDDCGNTSMTSFDVTVTSTNVATVSVQLVGVNVASMRCIRFQTNTCAFTDIPLAFDGTGLFTGDIEIPCGSYTMLCAKDEQHTEWHTVPLTISGTKYVATGTLDLEGGDTDNDGDVDINDVTWLIAQYGGLAASGSCPWDGTRDADFSNNGAVAAEDYGFQVANWLTTSACTCAIPLVSHRRGDHPEHLERKAYLRVTGAITKAADLNGDGWVDHLDVRLFENEQGLPNELSDILRNATPKIR